MAPLHPSRLVLASSILAVLLLGLASMASAQGAPGFHIGLSGGADIPVEDQSDVFNVGWNGTLMFVWNFGTSPFGLRLDGSYHQLKAKDELVLFTDGKTQIVDGTFDLVIGPHIGTYFQPYILGGVGAYGMKFSGTFLPLAEEFSDKTTEFGWNAGAGFAFRLGDATSAHLFVEGRYTSIDIDGNRFTDAVTTSGRKFTMVVVNTGVVF